MGIIELEQALKISEMMDKINGAMLNVGLGSPEHEKLKKIWNYYREALIKQVQNL